MRATTLLSVLIAGLVAAIACGNGSGASDASKAASIVAACMHICQCEAGTPDPSCQTDCTSGTGSSSANLSSSLVVSSGQLQVASQACIDCFDTASCTDIVNGTACASSCP